MRVKNVPNTSGLKCNCVSWLEHWEKFSRKKADYCSVYGCYESRNLQGSHVKRVDVNDPEVYILPFCPGHNQSASEMTIKEGYPLVSADPKKTCAK